jgi:uncharacterized membrane protein YgcG
MKSFRKEGACQYLLLNWYNSSCEKRTHKTQNSSAENMKLYSKLVFVTFALTAVSSVAGYSSSGGSSNGSSSGGSSSESGSSKGSKSGGSSSGGSSSAVQLCYRATCTSTK